MRESRKKNALERAADVLELPGEVLAGLSRLEFTGNRRLHIEGHRGILEYNSSLIAVNCGEVILKISGDNLEIVSMNADELLIIGYISGLAFA